MVKRKYLHPWFSERGHSTLELGQEKLEISGHAICGHECQRHFSPEDRTYQTSDELADGPPDGENG